MVLPLGFAEVVAGGANSGVVMTSTLVAMMGPVAGLSDKQLSRVRGRLEAFAGEMFEPLVRNVSVVGGTSWSAPGVVDT